MIETTEARTTMDNSSAEPTKFGSTGPVPEGSQRAWGARMPYNYAEDSRRKSPALAAFLSIMPGLGQVYIGYYQQGFINILVAASLITLITMRIRGLLPMVPIFLAFFWLYNILDAARRASFYNRALAGLGPETLPDDLSLPSGKGSLLAGSMLIAFGSIFLLHTKFDMPLDWIQDWWPVALLAVGGYLVYMHFTDKAKA